MEEMKKNIEYLTFQTFFIKFSPNDRTVSGHLMHIRDDLENVGRSQNVHKEIFLIGE